MKIDKITAAGLLLAILAIAFSVFVILQHSFPVSEYLVPSTFYVDTDQNVGLQDSKFLWTNRDVDLMAQALVIFTAAAGCLAMLRSEMKEKQS